VAQIRNGRGIREGGTGARNEWRVISNWLRLRKWSLIKKGGHSSGGRQQGKRVEKKSHKRKPGEKGKEKRKEAKIELSFRVAAGGE